MRALTLDERPVLVLWEVARRCRPECLRCRPAEVRDADPMPLSPSEALRLVAEIAALGAARLVLSGGDHRARPDLDAIVREAAARKLAVTVALCAPPAPSALVRLAAAGAHAIALVVDARASGGAITALARRVATAARAVRRAGLALQIDTTVTRASADDLPAIGTLVARLAPARWNVRVAVDEACAPRPEQYETMLHRLCEWASRTGLSLEATAAPALRRVAFERTEALPHAERPRARRACTAVPAPNDGKGVLFVSHSGDVYPSDRLPRSGGNVRRTPLAEIYRSAPLFREVRAYWRLEGKCGACPFFVPCGGSRARAYAASGNVLGEDPICGYQPLAYVAL